jgi:phosphatidylserine decarboxylase
MKIAREALFPSSILAVLGVAVGLWVHPLAALLPALLLLFTLWFFRDPQRSPPTDPQALLSPADGRIIKAGPEGVSIFMNVFNVHVCRTPCAGAVDSAEHISGRFLAAFREEAPQCNERLVVCVTNGALRVRFTLIAGLIARRIVCYVRPGDRLAQGQRMGMIRFGSRVDVDLPPGATVAVRLDQRVVAGETVLARLS